MGIEPIVLCPVPRTLLVVLYTHQSVSVLYSCFGTSWANRLSFSVLAEKLFSELQCSVSCRLIITSVTQYSWSAALMYIHLAIARQLRLGAILCTMVRNPLCRLHPFLSFLNFSSCLEICVWYPCNRPASQPSVPYRTVTNRVVWLVVIHDGHLIPCGYLGVNSMQIPGELRAPCNALPSLSPLTPFLTGQGDFIQGLSSNNFCEIGGAVLCNI